MTREIRIYVEGGGNGGNTKAVFRQGFREFLQEPAASARDKGIRWSIIACGSRNSTLEDFKMALRSHPDAFNVLLVDAEAPVNSSPSQHLHECDAWDLSGIQEDQCHLMVQIMESWFLSDVDALSNYYGQGFNANVLPKNPNVEDIDKAIVESSLKAATRNTQKGLYHKIHHGSDILMRLDVSKVREAAVHCEHLFAVLERKLNI
jgi:hypothetical protein